MAVSFEPPLFYDTVFLHFIGFFEHNLRAGDIRFQGIFAIFNLTLRPPYAILLSDYPVDNHSSRIQEGIAND
jgi:hypothetical protein